MFAMLVVSDDDVGGDDDVGCDDDVGGDDNVEVMRRRMPVKQAFLSAKQGSCPNDLEYLGAHRTLKF